MNFDTALQLIALLFPNAKPEDMFERVAKAYYENGRMTMMAPPLAGAQASRPDFDAMTDEEKAAMLVKSLRESAVYVVREVEGRAKRAQLEAELSEEAKALSALI